MRSQNLQHDAVADVPHPAITLYVCCMVCPHAQDGLLAGHVESASCRISRMSLVFYATPPPPSLLEPALPQLPALAVQMDITDLESVQQLAKQVTDIYESVDVLVNNAGVCCSGPFADTTMEDW